MCCRACHLVSIFVTTTSLVMPDQNTRTHCLGPGPDELCADPEAPSLEWGSSGSRTGWDRRLSCLLACPWSARTRGALCPSLDLCCGRLSLIKHLTASPVLGLKSTPPWSCWWWTFPCSPPPRAPPQSQPPRVSRWSRERRHPPPYSSVWIPGGLSP